MSDETIIIFHTLLENASYAYGVMVDGEKINGMILNKPLVEIAKEVEAKLKEFEEQEMQIRSELDETSLAYQTDISDSSFDTDVA